MLIIEVGIIVELLIVLQTGRMVHVGTIQEHSLLVEHKWTKADGTFVVFPLNGLLLDGLPFG